MVGLAQLVEARTKAQTQQIESAAYVAAQRASAEAAAESQRIRTESEVRALRESESAASAYTVVFRVLKVYRQAAVLDADLDAGEKPSAT